MKIHGSLIFSFSDTSMYILTNNYKQENEYVYYRQKSNQMKTSKTTGYKGNSEFNGLHTSVKDCF